ncbi:MAG TPA: lactate utilization protein [Bacteroidetes bacterium]|nr:lactate utilization protein [Bacteroidota bacterium]
MNKAHPQQAEAFIRNEERTDWHDQALWFVRTKRDTAINAVPEWEALRTLAGDIKLHTLSRLDEYLLEFEKNALANGVHVHWAADAEAHNKIVATILQKHKAQKVVKSKSMLTEECGLNHHLEQLGIEITDTDLGERIIQMRNEPPSHIVLPAIHLKKEEVGHLFEEQLGTEPNNADPAYLTNAARLHLREKFLEADAAITGVNFAVAQTGEVVVCTNEGNADMGTHLAPLQIHCMGIEKLIPKRKHLGIFTRILARSATGQAITVYTSHFRRPKPNGEMHIILVDNGRSEKLGQKDFFTALKCIRCGACINTCPIYRRSGGFSYHHTIPGPIGSILAPATDLKEYNDLPFASTLCGSCKDVCPVKIDIPHQLYLWRQEIGKAGYLGKVKQQTLKIAANVLANEKRYTLGGKLTRWILRHTPRQLINNPMNLWAKGREMPPAPKESFREWLKKERSSLHTPS